MGHGDSCVNTCVVAAHRGTVVCVSGANNGTVKYVRVCVLCVCQAPIAD